MTVKKDDFVHLHVHTEYSMLDGHALTTDLLKEVKAKGQIGVATTEHGNMHGSYELWTKARAMDLIPVIGIEAYMTPGGQHHSYKQPVSFGAAGGTDQEEGGDDVSAKGSYTHMTMLAGSTEGLHNLFRMSSLSYLEGMYKKPRMSIDMLAEHGKGVIATTGCPSGDVQTRLRLGQYKEAKEYAGRMQDILGRENFFLELMDHNMKSNLERGVRDDLLMLARELNMPLLATNDLHYTKREDAKHHEALLAMQTQGVLSEPPYNEGGKRFAFEGDSYYVKSGAEMRNLFSNYPEAITNTVLVAERASDVMFQEEDLRPTLELPPGYTAESFIREEITTGLIKRYGHEGITQEIKERVEHELSVIIPKRYIMYFLVTSDFVRWAKNNNVTVGPARGSAGGSLVAYALDITDLDPIRHGLLFERFLNPERDSPPDIDMDFDDKNRERVIEYVRDKYGAERVGYVATFGRIKAKSAIRDAAKVLELPIATANKLSKAFPPDTMGQSMPLASVYNPTSKRYNEAEDFRQVVKQENAEQLLDMAQGVEERIRQTGIHAAGIIISSKPLIDAVPLMARANNPAVITQFDYPTCEKLGLLKVDFLGLSNLTIIHDALDNIREARGEDIKLLDIFDSGMDDPATYQLLQEGNTLGVFQLDSGAIRDLLRRIAPTSFDDISATLALYRPGPMGVNAHINYADRKNDRQEVVPIHPELEAALEPVLGNTYGLCVSGDTLIWDATSGKMVRIDSVEQQIKDGTFYTFGVDDKGQSVRRKVTHWFKTGIKDTLSITTASGQNVKVSKDHPVLTTRGWVEAGELRTGQDRLAIPRTALNFEATSDVSEEEAALMGYLVGDGYITLNQNTFTNKDVELRNYVAELASALFDDVYPVHEAMNRSAPRVRFGASPAGVGRGRGIGRDGVYVNLSMNKWLINRMGYTTPTTSAHKFAPEIIKSGSVEARWAFLAGLFDADGCLTPQLTYLRTISKSLVEDVQEIISSLGYLSKISTSEQYESTKGTQTPYSLHVYDLDFRKELTARLKSSHKKDIVPSIPDCAVRHRGVSLSAMLEHMRGIISKDTTLTSVRPERMKNHPLTMKVLNAYFVEKGLLPKKGSSFLTYPEGNYAPASLTVQTYLDNYAGEEQSLYAEQNWSLAKTIEALEPEMMYDITVEEVHNFLGNSLVLHNCIYQEQVMESAQHLAGFSLAEADNLRRAMGKKDKAILDEEFVPFSAGMKEKGFSKESTQALWDVLVPFADYAFNKSHSVGYGLISYATAYLKANYPAEYMAALLTTSSDDPDKMALYLQECKRMGLEVLPPSVAKSSVKYSKTGDVTITVGLSSVRNVGYAAAQHIIDSRPAKGNYETLQDFLSNIPREVLNRRVLEGLAAGGGLDEFGYSRRALQAAIPDLVSAYNTLRKKSDEGQESLFDLFGEGEDDLTPEIKIHNLPEFSKKEKLSRERYALGLYVSDHPLSGMVDALATRSSTTTADIKEASVPIAVGFDNSTPKQTLAGLLSSVVVKTSRNGDKFAIVTIEDMLGSIEAPIFPKMYAQIGEQLKQDSIYTFTGTPRYRDDEGSEISFMVDHLEEIESDDEGLMLTWFKIFEDQSSHKAVAAFREVLQRHPGSSIPYVSIRQKDGSIRVINMGKELAIEDSATLRRDVHGVFGIGSLGRW